MSPSLAYASVQVCFRLPSLLLQRLLEARFNKPFKPDPDYLVEGKGTHR